jgi:hypothetical protein
MNRSLCIQGILICARPPKQEGDRKVQLEYPQLLLHFGRSYIPHLSQDVKTGTQIFSPLLTGGLTEWIFLTSSDTNLQSLNRGLNPYSPISSILPRGFIHSTTLTPLVKEWWNNNKKLRRSTMNGDIEQIYWRS